MVAECIPSAECGQKRAESAAVEGGQKRIESAEGGQNSQNALSQQRVL